MKLEYQLSLEDFREGAGAASIGFRWFLFLLGVALLTVAATVFFLQPENRSFAVQPALIGCLILLSLLLSRWYLARQWHQQPAGVREPVTMEVSTEGLTARGARGESRLRWHNFIRLRETPRLFLLQQAPGHFHAIPKRVFTGKEQENEFREYVRQQMSLAAGKPASP